jgi:hypothetical protein
MQIEENNKKRMQDLLDYYDSNEIDVSMKFPEATAYND